LKIDQTGEIIMEIVNTAVDSVKGNAQTMLNIFIPLCVGTFVIGVIMGMKK
jgi:hypothetical protein